MFRLSALGFWLAAVVGIYWFQRPLQLSKVEKFSLVIMLILSFLIIRQNGSIYLISLDDSMEIYGWTLDATRSIFGSFGYIFDMVIHYLFRLTILFGGREAAYTEGIQSVLSYKFGIYQLIAMPVFALLHLLGLVSFVRFSQRSRSIGPVLISFIAIIGAIFTVGHMRYILPYQPMILIGILYLAEEKVFGKNCTNPSISTK